MKKRFFIITILSISFLSHAMEYENEQENQFYTLTSKADYEQALNNLNSEIITLSNNIDNNNIPSAAAEASFDTIMAKLDELTALRGAYGYSATFDSIFTYLHGLRQRVGKFPATNQ